MDGRNSSIYQCSQQKTFSLSQQPYQMPDRTPPTKSSLIFFENYLFLIASLENNYF